MTTCAVRPMKAVAASSQTHIDLVAQRLCQNTSRKQSTGTSPKTMFATNRLVRPSAELTQNGKGGVQTIMVSESLNETESAARCRKQRQYGNGTSVRDTTRCIKTASRGTKRQTSC